MSRRRRPAGWRRPAMAVAGGLLLAACTPAAAPDQPTDPQTLVIDEVEGEDPAAPAPGPDEADPPDTDDTGDPHDAGGAAAAPPADAREEQPEPSGTGADPAGPGPAPAPDRQDGGEHREAPGGGTIDDRGPLGSACRALLRPEVPGLTIEVLHQAGARPSAGALDHLVATLEPVLDKPAGVELQQREIPGGARTWSVEELRTLAASHRTATSTPERAGLLVLSVAGEFEEPGVLGLAMNATEVVLFPQQVGDLGTTLLGGSARIERAVLVHEVGHLLCLVNIGYTSPRDHEDPDHPHHSRHRDSVMYWAVPNDAITQVFAGPPPDRFHADDLADLQDLREGRR